MAMIVVHSYLKFEPKVSTVRILYGKLSSDQVNLLMLEAQNATISSSGSEFFPGKRVIFLVCSFGRHKQQSFT